MHMVHTHTCKQNTHKLQFSKTFKKEQDKGPKLFIRKMGSCLRYQEEVATVSPHLQGKEMGNKSRESEFGIGSGLV